MRRDDHMLALDDILSRWHHHSSGYNPMKAPGADPMFRNAKSGRGWDTGEGVDDALNNSTMERVDFEVSEMVDPHRTAIHINARNCATGRKVWMSPRLPADPLACAVIVGEARAMLSDRLVNVGVL